MNIEYVDLLGVLTGSLIATFVLYKIIKILLFKFWNGIKLSIATLLVSSIILLNITTLTMGFEDGAKTYIPTLLLWFLIDFIKVKNADMFKKVLIPIISFGIVFIAYILINGGFFLVQEVFKSDEKAQLESLEKQLSTERDQILKVENEIKIMRQDLEVLNDRLLDLDSTIVEYENSYPDGIPEEYYEDYTSSIELYNSILAEYEDLYESQNLEYQDYNESINKFNKKVKEAELLAKDVGSTWIVLPIGKR